MKVKDLDDFKSPNRKPWLILILIVIAGVIFLWNENQKKTKKAQELQRRVEIVAEKFEAEARSTNETSSAQSEQPSSLQTPVSPVNIANTGEMLKKAQALEGKRQFVAAQKIYLDILKMPIEDNIRKSVEVRVGKINIDLIMTPYAMPEKIDYVVKRGDSLDKIAKKVGTTVGLIAKSNNVKNPSRIKAGDMLRVFKGKLSVKVSKSNIDLIVYMNGEFFKRYSVGTGKFGKTPVGTFKITEKQKEPVWWHPSGKSYQFGEPENILGTRWMTLKATGDTPDVKGYGIHGTWKPESIGKAESAGCVRMRNSEVEELYTYLPTGTVVTIVE
jgi:lipoprotein-anchoring transpeptidase ErfK/SrfK